MGDNPTFLLTSAVQLGLQDASIDIWDSKYRLKSKDGQIVDHTVDDTYKRVARELANQEVPELRDEMYHEFLTALRNGATPAGRVTSNAGAQDHKPATSTINCTVSGTIEDSMQSILYGNYLAGMTLRAGCGIGYEFSTLRPRGAFVAGAGATTSGPVSFMDVYDSMCRTVASAGGRRGAQMGTFDVAHPDVEEFVLAKREAGRLRQFNLSLLVSADFIHAVETDGAWPLSFPLHHSERDQVDVNDPTQVVWREWPVHHNTYTINADGLVASKVYKTVKAKSLWNLIMASTYDYAEPGFILIDRVNEMNNNWWCENIRATNPCGEQGLPPFGSCLLGSINLTHYVVNPFTKHATFDKAAFAQTVRTFTRMLDNVVEINGLPLHEQREEIRRKRRHGMGYLGLGSAMTMMGITYGSAESLQFTEDVTRLMAVEGWRVGLELAKEKGAAPILDEVFEVTPSMLRKRPEMIADGYKVGDLVPGRILHARYSRYMQRLAEVEPALVAELAEVGARFTHHTSIAPTGTIALSFGNNASNGIEPSFAHKYGRNVIREGRKTKEKIDVYSYELLAYREFVDAAADPDAGTLPSYFISADSISPKAHIDVQAAAQKWVDSAISKTCNVPTGIPFDEFKDLYTYAASQGLKGCTTFRFNPSNFQGVLVKDKDLENTTYVFSLEDGTEVRVKGNEEIEYDGETHTAANLFDALKDGYYGKL